MGKQLGKASFGKPLTIQQQEVPRQALGQMRETVICQVPIADLLSRLDEDGYLLLRQVYDPNEVIAARIEVLRRLAEVGEVAEPYGDAIATGQSHRAKMHPDLGAFWRSVSESKQLRAVINGPAIAKVMEGIFAQPVTHFSFAWLRAMPAGRASPVHVDHPYMNRGSKKLLSCWTPLGDIAIDEGPLYVLERSHKWQECRDRFEGHDVDYDKSRPGHFHEHPLELAKKHQSRFLTSSFAPGDCMVFGMFLAHGSFDNNSQSGKIRLSCDTRFQPANEDMDERFSGSDPLGHDGLGYGCLAASKPMTENMQLR